MEQVTEIFLKGVFFFIVGAVLITLFIWALIQGALIHASAPALAPLYYFAAVTAGIGGIALYHQAKYALRYVKMAK
jgi:hypothetical protein